MRYMVILCSLQTFHDLPVVSSQCVSSTSHVAQVPFDSPEYYHQRNRGAGQSFEVRVTRWDQGRRWNEKT